MIKVNIRMLATARGSQTGATTETFEQGKVYDVTPSLAAAFIDGGQAEQVKETKPSPALETKPAPKKRGRPRKSGA